MIKHTCKGAGQENQKRHARVHFNVCLQDRFPQKFSVFPPLVTQFIFLHPSLLLLLLLLGIQPATRSRFEMYIHKHLKGPGFSYMLTCLTLKGPNRITNKKRDVSNTLLSFNLNDLI